MGNVKEVVPPGKLLPKTRNVDVPTAPIPMAPQIRCGYIIGIREDGNIVFELLGNAPGLAELLGLHEVASERLKNKMDNQVASRYKIIVDKLNAILETIRSKEKI